MRVRDLSARDWVYGALWAAALVLADHQPLVPCRRLPVHASEVVARRVFAEHQELAADVELPDDAAVVGIEIIAAAFRKRHHVVDARLHDHLVETGGVFRARWLRGLKWQCK